MQRNTFGHDRGRYDADLAHARSAQRARRRRPGRLWTDPQLRAVVQAKLELDWSPQQISVWLRREHPGRLVHLPNGRSADAFAEAALQVLATVPTLARRTLTGDQGAEMARHELLAWQFPEGIYFARPGSPWMRATNENTNGLLRQYFPKNHRPVRARARGPARRGTPNQYPASEGPRVANCGGGVRNRADSLTATGR